jgi:Dimethlysulfonioproprionate lyase
LRRLRLGIQPLLCAIEPSLEWRRRASFDETASANFVDGHANAMILGPAGLEHRNDVWIGASLIAPFVRYTDHAHAPEETYLVLSEGDFRQGDAEWFTPGVGGSFYNPPWIKHAMRSGAAPLFAFWALCVNSA